MSCKQVGGNMTKNGIENNMKEFDFDSIRLSPTFLADVMADKLITTIPVRKPKSDTEFFRVRKSDEWTFPLVLLDTKEGEEGKYVVTRSLIPEVQKIAPGKLKSVMIYTLINREGVLFLSDIPLPDEDGKDNEYHRSRRQGYKIGITDWVKIRPNKSLGAYEIFRAIGELPAPVWPDETKTMNSALKIAFKDKIIDSADHPVLQDLRGE